MSSTLLNRNEKMRRLFSTPYPTTVKQSKVQVVQGAVRAHTDSMQPNRNTKIRCLFLRPI